MKKVFSILIVSIVLLSLLSLCVFAEDNPSDVLNTKWVIVSNPVVSSDFSWHIDFYSAGEYFDYIYFPAGGSLFYFHSYTSGQYVTAYSSTSGWVKEAYRTIYIVGGTTSDSVRINLFSSFADFIGYDDTPLVSTGVSSSIGFVGQVLNFITSNVSILAIVGLSIGLAIIPFAVVKLKEFVKGY